jgi:hypothetical protein
MTKFNFQSSSSSAGVPLANLRRRFAGDELRRTFQWIVLMELVESFGNASGPQWAQALGLRKKENFALFQVNDEKLQRRYLGTLTNEPFLCPP